MASQINSLVDWRKKVAKTAATSITIDEWTAIFEVLTGNTESQSTLDVLALLLITLRQLAYIWFVDPDENHDELAALIHERLVPSLQRPEIGSASLARLLVDSLQDPSKPIQNRAIDCLYASTKLSQALPAPATSSSKPTSVLVPLFRYVISQGADQKWTLTALVNILPSIPVGEVPESLLQKLLEEMEVSDNIAIRANVVVAILTARWAAHSSSQEHQAEEDFHRIMYEPVLPLFNPSSMSSQTWQNVQRYLYPALNNVKSPSGRGFLHYLETLPTDGELDSDAQLECWISIASASIQAKSLGIRDIDESRLSQALCHANASVRLKAFIICSQNEDLLYDKGIKALKSAFIYNASLHGQGERSEFGSAVYNLFTHLEQETHAARRAAQRVEQGHKAIKGFEVKDETDGTPCPRQTILLDPTRAVEVAEEFKDHILQFWIRPGLASARRHPVSKVLVSLIVMKLYLDIFGSEEGMQEKVFTRETVDNLLSCQASEFTDVRRRARTILDMATIPLPAYESLGTSAAQALRSSATSSLAHPRKTQAEAGRSALCILFTKLVLGTDDETSFVVDLIDRLDDHLLACETELRSGIESKPLHGLLAAIRDLVCCLDLSSHEAQIRWKPVLHRLVQVVDRVWAVTRPVISLKSSGLAGPEGRPDHEIARAYEVANGGDMEGEGDDEEGGSDITGLLSGCWRATTGAGDLLSSIVSVALIDSQSNDFIWSRGDVDAVGERFLTWMHEVRHRGTFSKIAVAFASLVQAVKPVSALSDLPLAWLERELGTVREDTLSTTRRSAALPYSILAIITGDAALTDRAITSLLGMADVKSSTSDITKVHAFNVLQVSLPHAKQAKFLDRYFERAVMTSIGAFESPNWNVRNVGLILFSTLINRSLSLGKSHDWLEYRTPSATRQTYLAWHTKYPLLLPYIKVYLSDYDLAATASQHSPLFPMLIIIRSLRCSDTGHAMQDSLVPAVERFLGSREWQVRRVAAQALTSLLSHKQALLRVTNWNVGSTSTSNNELHGRLQLLARLIEDVIDWPKVDNLSKRQVERNLSVLLESHGNSRLMDIFNTVVQCVGSYVEQTNTTNDALLDSATAIAERVLLAPELAGQPIHGMQMWLSVAFLLTHRPSKDTVLRLLASTNASPHVQQCPALWALQGMMGPTYDEHIDKEVFLQVLALARSSVHDDAVRTSAMGVLRDLDWPDAVLEAVDRSVIEGFVRDMLCAVRRTKYVPIREAALPALAWGVAWLSEVGGGNAPFHQLGLELLKSSHEDESLPARESALEALRLIGKHLFPEANTTSSAPRSADLLPLHQTLDRLLHDDDSDLRDGAANIVRTGLQHPTPISTEKALGLWMEWFHAHTRQLDQDAAKGWYDWLVDQVIDAAGIEVDRKALTVTAHQPDVLFEVEPSNLFRDSVEDARLIVAIRALSLIRPERPPDLSTDNVDRIVAARDQVDAILRTSSVESYSPIDDAWEARRVLLVRQEALWSFFRLM